MPKTKMYTSRMVRNHKAELATHDPVPKIVREFQSHFHHRCDLQDRRCKVWKDSVEQLGKRKAQRMWRKTKQRAGLK